MMYLATEPTATIANLIGDYGGRNLVRMTFLLHHKGIERDGEFSPSFSTYFQQGDHGVRKLV